MLIEIKELAKDYSLGNNMVVPALMDVNLTIEKNEYVAIMGPSGSGKSTLMNILGCLDTPTKGHYYFNGTDVSSLDDDSLSAMRNREIGVHFPELQPAAQAKFGSERGVAAGLCRHAPAGATREGAQGFGARGPLGKGRP